MEEKKPLVEENEKEEVPAAEQKEYVPKGKFDSLLYRIYVEKGVSLMLKAASVMIVAATVMSFLVYLLELVLKNPLMLVEALIITGVPFIALSIMRVIINAPRPYEVLEFYEKPPKRKCGRSFPSRHVFSVFIVATVIMPSNIALGILLLIMGVCLAAFRVLLGIHFIRDVVAGALTGIISGVVGLLAILFI